MVSAWKLHDYSFSSANCSWKDVIGNMRGSELKEEKASAMDRHINSSRKT